MSVVGARCLVLTLASGENEYARCRASVRAQSLPRREHVVFEGLPNREAHARLYGEVMRRSDEYDLFVKLDADMVLLHEESLESIAAFFARRPDLDHAMFSLRDFLSDGPLMGLHAFSPRARWNPGPENLFVDPDPEVPGLRMIVRGAPGPVAFHSPDPSPYQAFHFGVHRALKAFQFGRSTFRQDQARQQWALLTRVWEHFRRSGERRAGLAVLGADLVWRREIVDAGETFDDPRIRGIYQRHAAWGADRIHEALRGRFSPALVRRLRWAATVGGKVVRGIVAGRLTRDATGAGR